MLGFSPFSSLPFSTIPTTGGGVAYSLSCANGSYAVNGQSATLTYSSGRINYTLSCAKGTYLVNGQSAILDYSNAGTGWGTKGGIGKKKKEHIAQSKRSEIKEYLATIFAEPVVEEEMLEALQPYAKEEVTPNAIDYDLLLNSVEMVQNIIARAQAIQQEHEDEEALLMLI
jgi:hypothetical protein